MKLGSIAQIFVKFYAPRPFDRRRRLTTRALRRPEADFASDPSYKKQCVRFLWIPLARFRQSTKKSRH
jgi:hypothetical protein